MSMKAYFEKLQQEHNVTCVEFVADHARAPDGRVSQHIISSMMKQQEIDSQVVRERPSFHSDSERMSSAPRRPSRTSSVENLVTLSQLEEAFVLLNLSSAMRVEQTRASTKLVHHQYSLNKCKPSLKHTGTSTTLNTASSVLVSSSE